MEVTTGYNLKDARVIPEGWKAVTLGDISTVCAGGTPSRMKPRYWGGNIAWVTTSEVDFGRITETNQYITREGLDNSAAKLLPPETILIALYGQGKTRGKIAILAIEAATNQACAAISVTSGVLIEFAFYYLASRYEAIRKLSNTGNQENLNSAIVRSIHILLPPEAEQHAIASALSDVDALLVGLDRLITKKHDIKQATMQKLLTGHVRLPGFSDDWEVRRLEDVAPLQRGFDLPNPMLRSGPYPVVYSNGVLNHHASFQTQGPGVVTGRSGTIGTVTFVDGPYWPHNTSLWVTSFKDSDPRFVFYLYTHIRFERFATGSGVPTLNRNDVHAFEVAIPATTAEQTAIAAVLSDMDAELSALESRRAKTRALKQAMMQELLTGKKRLL
jgi:type I restriction enzyme S subunit